MMRWVAAAFVLGLLIGVGGMVLIPRAEFDRVAALGTPSGNGDVNGDGSLNISDAVYLLYYLFAEGPAPEPIVCPAGALPATGQETCYDRAGNAIDCASADYPGQDGFYRAGCPKEGRYVDNGDGTVSDTCTGLMWAKAPAPNLMTWQDALKYCENLTLAGKSDWRLPNINEVHSLVRYDRVISTPSIDPVFDFPARPGVLAEWWYWSSSSDVNSPRDAWGVHFRYGNVYVNDKSYGNRVRAVRGGL